LGARKYLFSRENSMKRARLQAGLSAEREGSPVSDENFLSRSPSSQGSLHGEKSATGEQTAENVDANNVSELPVAAPGFPDENPASDGDGQEISNMMDDMIVRNRPENRRRVVDSAENSNRGSSPTGSLNDIMVEQVQFLDENFPPYLRKAVARVPATLCNFGTIKYDISTKVYRDKRGVISVPPRHVRTMDGSGKCFQLIPKEDWSAYTQPYEAAPWVFVSE
jgi:hypothetical protein